MIIITTSLDKAAFYLSCGSTLKEITGKYPDNRFSFETNRLVYAYEKANGPVGWKTICNNRKILKRKTRELAGLPAYFTGWQPAGFELQDIATVKPWSNKEKDRLKI